MGNRANIAILTEHGTSQHHEQIWLYTHWGGNGLFTRLRRALDAAAPRWSDPSYCARIIVSRCIPEDSHDEETGHGLSTRITDNEYAILVVDIESKTVYLIAEDSLTDGKVPAAYVAPAKFSWTFKKFIGLTKDPRRVFSDTVHA